MCDTMYDLQVLWGVTRNGIKSFEYRYCIPMYIYLFTPQVLICINNRQLLKTSLENKKMLVAPSFPKMFSTQQKTASPFVIIFDIISLFAAELEEPKIGMRGKELLLLTL